MANLLLLAICFVAGWLARKSGRFPDATPLVLNGWVLWLALPALIIGTIHKVPFRPELFLAAGSLWLVFIVAAVLALLAVRLNLATKRTAGMLGLTAGLGNTAFMGLPLLEAFAGQKGIELGIVVDQLGSFLVLSLLAVPFAAHMGGGQASVRLVLQRVVRFPPFIALVLALFTRPFAYPLLVEQVLARLAETLSTLALASVGYQLHLSALRTRVRPLSIGLLYKLVLAPLLAFAFLYALSPLFGTLEKVAVTQAAMAPMVTATVLALDYGLDPELGAVMLGVGAPLSLLTTPLVWWLLGVPHA